MVPGSGSWTSSTSSITRTSYRTSAVLDAANEHPTLEHLRTTGMVDHIHVISRTRWKSRRPSQAAGDTGPERDVLRGGRRVAPLVSTEYTMKISRPHRRAQDRIGLDGRKRVTGTRRWVGYDLMMTRAPMSTSSKSSSESSMNMRMHPCDAYVPIDDELYDPWMRIPGAFR
jgi:hypothetical protein